MPAGAFMAARQALGQYLVYGKPWQRTLVVAGAVVGGPALLVAGIVTGHFVMAVIGGVLLAAVGNGFVQVLRGRWARRRAGPPGTAGTGDG
jgi:hypothetical protein